MDRLTRRGMGAGLAITLAGGVPRALGAAPLFRDIPDLVVPPHLQRVSTRGHGREGLGGAVYRRCAPGPATAFRTYSADGACWELAGHQVAPEQAGAAGDGQADDREALMAAQALARPITLTAGRTYRVGATMALGVPISGAGKISAGPGFRGDVLIHGQHGFHLRDAVLDGAGLPAPAHRWIGVGPPTGCAMFLEGRPEAPLDQPQLDGVIIRNTPGGGVFVKYAQGIRINNLRADGVQTQRAFITNAVVELYRCDDGQLTHCAIRDYGWKGYSLGACKRTVASACTADGGNLGHAAHYIDDCEDSGFIDCSHTGGGYAAKASNALRAYFHGYRSAGSAGGLQVQSCRDFEARDVEVADSQGAAFVISSSTAGPLLGCRITGATARWSQPPSPTQLGVLVTCNGAPNSAVTGVVIQDLNVDGAFSGVACRPAKGSNVDLDLRAVAIRGSQQYGVVAFVRGLAITGGAVEGGGRFPAIAVFSNDGAPGAAVALSGLDLSGASGSGPLVQVGGDGARGATFSGLSLVGNAALGGRGLLAARLNGGQPAHIELRDNIATGLAGVDGADVTLDDGARGDLVATGNRFVEVSGEPAALRVGPRAALISVRSNDNQAAVVVS